MTPAIQHALFALPHLSFLKLGLVDVTDVELPESALLLASNLRCVRVEVRTADVHAIRALRAAPNLTSLRLDALSHANDTIPLGPFLCALPHTLTQLTLDTFSLEPDSTPPSALRAMCMQLPLLQQLHTQQMEMSPLVQALLDAGPVALPALRRVELLNGLDDDLTDLVPRFHRTFASASLLIDAELRRSAGRRHMRALLRSCRGCERVEFNPRALDLSQEDSDSDDDAHLYADHHEAQWGRQELE